jgi:hypothetical protein
MVVSAFSAGRKKFLLFALAKKGIVITLRAPS